MAVASDPAPTRGERTRGRLLEAGSAVFAERGYHAARVDDVVKTARTSHGTFYLYFSNKQDLFRALATEVAREMAALAGEFPTFPPVGESPAAVRTWLGRFAELYDREGAVIQAWTEAEISDSEFGRIGGNLVREFIARIAAGIAPAAPDLDALMAATAIVAMIERAYYLFVSGTPAKADRDVVLDTLAGAIYAGVYGTGGARETT
jgi:AcrR family transcriptional regulator